MLTLTEAHNTFEKKVYVTKGVKKTTGYDCDTYAAPFIHAYNDFEMALYPRIVLAREFCDQKYTIRRFLVVQPLEEAIQGTHVAIKPHRAISLNNGRAFSCALECQILVYNDNERVCSENQSVHTHGGTLSPGVESTGLVDSIRNKATDVLITSYVTDNTNQQIIITEHCLLTIDHLSQFDRLQAPTTADLTGINRVLDTGLERFFSQNFELDKNRMQPTPVVPEQLLTQLNSKYNELNTLSTPKYAALGDIIACLNALKAGTTGLQEGVQRISAQLAVLAEHRNPLHRAFEYFFRNGLKVNFFSTKSLKLAERLLNELNSPLCQDRSTSTI